MYGMNLLNNVVVKTLPYIPKSVVSAIAKRYIAGETLSDAVNKVRQLNSENTMTTIDVLGEDIFTQDQASESKHNSLAVLNVIANQLEHTNLSIKLTSLGLKREPQFCIDNVDEIVSIAQKQNTFVRIDMEDHTCTDKTLNVYYTMRRKYKNVGIVIQAYLFRSERDIRMLAVEKAHVRLCKGIYNEPSYIAVKDQKEIQKNYLKLLRILLEARCYVGIATHDDVLINGAIEMVKEYKLKPDEYEFQMLLGVRDDRRKQLIEQGHRLRVYVPFGKEWYGYSVRRVKENPQMAGHIFKAIIGIRF